MREGDLGHLIAVAFGIAVRSRKDRSIATVSDLVDTALETLLTLLHWIIEIIPLAVFGIVASLIGVQGIRGIQFHSGVHRRGAAGPRAPGDLLPGPHPVRLRGFPAFKFLPRYARRPRDGVLDRQPRR